MKKIVIILILFLLPSVCLADFDLEKWQYYKNIEQASGDVVKFVIDDEVFSGAKDNLADLRIIDNNNGEVPYKLVITNSQNKSDSFYPKMLNNSFVPKENSLVILGMQGGGKIINQLKIITPSENFQRNVIVYGSENKIDWKIIKDDGYIYDYTDDIAKIKTQNTTINFSPSVYRYLKIEISDPEGVPVEISRVEAVDYIKETAKQVKRQPEFFINQNEEEKLSEIVIDLGAKGIPTGQAILTSTDKNFNRGVLIYSSNDQKDWRYVGGDYIFRYNTPKFTGENLQINFREADGRYIKLAIVNKDNQPINITGITTFSIYREIVFQPKNDKSYKFYYGNKDARFPEYDLQNYFRYLNVEQSKIATLSAQKDNSAYSAPVEPLSERTPYLLPGFLIFAILILLFLVYRFFKK